MAQNLLYLKNIKAPKWNSHWRNSNSEQFFEEFGYIVSSGVNPREAVVVQFPWQGRNHYNDCPRSLNLSNFRQWQAVGSFLSSKNSFKQQLQSFVSPLTERNWTASASCLSLLKAFGFCLGITILKSCSLYTCQVMPLEKGRSIDFRRTACVLQPLCVYKPRFYLGLPPLRLTGDLLRG